MSVPHHSTLFPYTTLFRSPIMMLRSPVRSFMSTAFTPSNAGLLATWMVPEAGGISPAMARSKVDFPDRSEEHTSELQSRGHIVCRLLLEKKNIEEHTIKEQ